MKGMRAARDLGPLVLVVLLIACALGEPRSKRPSPGTIAVLLDVSGSVPLAIRAAAAAEIEQALHGLPRRTQVAIFAFGEEPRLLGVGPSSAAVSWLRSAATLFAGETTTDLGRALAEASRLVLASGGGSILVATDGQDMAGGGLAAAGAAARAGVDVNVLPLHSRAEADVAIEALRVPRELRAEEIFEATALVRSMVDQDVELILEQDGASVASLRATLTSGAAHALRLVTRAGRSSGSLAAFVVPEQDQDPGNNLARAPLAISGTARFGVVGYGGPLGVEADRWDRLPPRGLLDRYDAVLVRLTDARPLSREDQEELARYANEGRGLTLACADPEAAAALRGGALEHALPVRLEPPGRGGDEAAVVLLVDRSGSMDRAGAGPSALSVALEGARALASLLADGDRYGLIAFDVEPHVLRRLGPARRPTPDPLELPELGAAGGTDWSLSLDLALMWLRADPAARRHVVLISDGRLAPDAKGEAARAWPEGVTLSTVSIGADANLETLEKLAVRYGGRHDHAARLEDLPAALRREGARLRPPRVALGPTIARPGAGFVSLLSPVMILRRRGVLVVSAREGSEIALRTEQGDPLLTFGRTGWGRSAFLAVDPSSLDEPVRVLAAALRRTGGADLPGSPAVFISVRRGRAEVDVLVDRGQDSLPRASVRFPSGRDAHLDMAWIAPGRARASFLISEAGAYLVEANDSRQRLLVASPPERTFLPADPDWAERLAGAGGGRVVSARALPSVRSREQVRDMAPGLICLAALLFFIDSIFRWRWSAQTRA